MNTEPDRHNIIDLIQKDDHIAYQKVIDSLAEAIEQLAREKDARLEERFYLISIIIILADVIFCQIVPWYMAMFIMVVELPLMLSFSESCGVDRFVKWADWVRVAVHEHYKKDKET